MLYLPVATARFNNNRDIAMIRTGKTRSADVDILRGSRVSISCYKYIAVVAVHC